MNEEIEELNSKIERLSKQIERLHKESELEKANVRINYFLNFLIVQTFLILYVFDIHLFGLSVLYEIIIFSIIFTGFYWKENIIYYKNFIKKIFLRIY